MIEFLGNHSGSVDKVSEEDSAKEGAGEVLPNTSVRYMDGSSVYHPDKECIILRAEERIARRKAVGYLLGQLKKLKTSGKLDLCAACDEEKIITIPKDPYAPR